MERQEWLENLSQGNVVMESCSSGQILVRIEEIKRGRIWYSNVNGERNLRCVNGDTGRSSDFSRHIIPQEPYDEDADQYLNPMCMPLTTI
jgi:hypothetical protein